MLWRISSPTSRGYIVWKQCRNEQWSLSDSFFQITVSWSMVIWTKMSLCLKLHSQVSVWKHNFHSKAFTWIKELWTYSHIWKTLKHERCNHVVPKGIVCIECGYDKCCSRNWSNQSKEVNLRGASGLLANSLSASTYESFSRTFNDANLCIILSFDFSGIHRN